MCHVLPRTSLWYFYVFSGLSGSLNPALLSVENWVPHKTVLGGERDVAFIHYPSCITTIKQGLQFSCNFIAINASKGSFFFQMFILFFYNRSHGSRRCPENHRCFPLTWFLTGALLQSTDLDNQIYRNNYILGQLKVLQSCLSLVCPTQSAPRYWGAGFVHVRVLSCVPPAHVTVQLSQAVHVVNPPSTTHYKKKIFLLSKRSNSRLNLLDIFVINFNRLIYLFLTLITCWIYLNDLSIFSFGQSIQSWRDFNV
jgi:hypothetical protein